jgi:hypothetical protein
MNEDIFKQEMKEAANIAVRWCGEDKYWEAFLLILMMAEYRKEHGYD